MYGIKYLRRKKAWYTTPIIDEEAKTQRKKASRKPGWDDTQHDLSKWKLAPEELERRRKERISKNLPKASRSKDGYDSDVSSDSRASCKDCDLRDAFSKVARQLQQQQTGDTAHDATNHADTPPHSPRPHRDYRSTTSSSSPSPQSTASPRRESSGPSRTLHVPAEDIATTPNSAEKPGHLNTAHPTYDALRSHLGSGIPDSTHMKVVDLEAEVADLKLQVSSLKHHLSLHESNFQEYTTHTSSIISRLQRQLQDLFNTSPDLLMASASTSRAVTAQPSSASLSSRNDTPAPPTNQTPPPLPSPPPSRTISTVVPHQHVFHHPTLRIVDPLADIITHPTYSQSTPHSHDPTLPSTHTLSSPHTATMRPAQATHTVHTHAPASSHQQPPHPSSQATPELQQESSLPSYRELRRRTTAGSASSTLYPPASSTNSFRDISSSGHDHFAKAHIQTFRPSQVATSSHHGARSSPASGQHQSRSWAHSTTNGAQGGAHDATPPGDAYNSYQPASHSAPLTSAPPPADPHSTRYALYSGGPPPPTHAVDWQQQQHSSDGLHQSSSSELSPRRHPPPLPTSTSTYGDHILTSTQRLQGLYSSSSSALYPPLSMDHLPDLSRAMYNPPSSYLSPREPPPPPGPVVPPRMVNLSETLSFNALAASVSRSNDSWT